MRLDGMISGLVDTIRAVFEASNLLKQQRQGALTRQLAGWAVILSAPTAIAGIYSMNFPSMPQLHAPLGVAIVVGVAVDLRGLVRSIQETALAVTPSGVPLLLRTGSFRPGRTKPVPQSFACPPLDPREYA
jgi:Mg2+ and Co2+ transporters